MSDVTHTKFEEFLEDIADDESGNLADFCEERRLDHDFMQAATLMGMSMLLEFLDKEDSTLMSPQLRKRLIDYDNRIHRELDEVKHILEG